MDIDQDEPPNLVDVGNTESQDSTTTQLQDLKLCKVPLTIITEFGDSADIEKALTVTQDGQEVQEWLELGNGCICCSIKDSGVNAIESLMDRRGTFDYIMLETSGLADPGNLAPLFWVDDGLGSSIYLDGIVTLVDAKNIQFSLDEKPLGSDDHLDKQELRHSGPHMTTAHLQISHADVIIINKIDSVGAKQLAAVEERVRSINGLAKIQRSQHSQIPQLESVLLNLHAYDGVGTLDTGSKGHSHLDPTISTMTLSVPTLNPSLQAKFEGWLRALLWDSQLPSRSPNTGLQLSPSDFSVHRTKGRVFTTDGKSKMIQGVREVFEIVDIDEIPVYTGPMEGKLVLIGRGLDGEKFSRSLRDCLGYGE